MSDTNDLFISGQTLQRIFDNDDLVVAQNWEELKAKLTALIVYMLLHEMEKLLGILYRIDVNEKKVKAAFAQSNPQAIAPILAELIIQRELQKAESRKINKA